MFLFILFLPTQLGKHFFFDFSYLSGVRVDYLAPTIYFTDLIFLLLFALNYQTIAKNFWKIKWFFAILIINLLAAFSKPVFFYYSLRILQLLAVFFIFKKIKISYQAVLLAFLLGGIVELFLSVAQIIYHRSLQGIFYFLGERYFTSGTPGIAKASLNGTEFLRPYGTFSHPNSLGGFYLLVYLFIATNKKFSQFAFLKPFSLLIFTLLIFLSFSKLATLTFLILIFFYLVFSSKINCKICLTSQLVLLTILSLIFLQAAGDPLSFKKRLELFRNSLTIIFNHPVFGVGLGNYLVAQNQFISKYFLFLNQPVHNIFLLFFAEIGIPFGLFLFYKLFIFLKKNLLTLFYLLMAILITGLFDHYWLTLRQNFLLMAVVFGLSLRPKKLFQD